MKTSGLNKSIFALHLIAAGLCSIPFLVTPIPGMIDYPNHLAHFYILTRDCKYIDLNQYYQINPAFIPNMGLELFIAGLHRLFRADVISLSKFVVAAVTVTLILAVGFLHSAFYKRWSYVTLCTIVIVYNYVVIYGFLNYVAGISLASFAAGAWIQNRHRSLLALVPIFSGVTLGLSGVHVFSLLIYGLLFFGYEGWSLLSAVKGRRRALFGRQLVLCLSFLPALILPLLLSHVGQNVSTSRIKWSTWWDKALALYSVFDLGEPWIGVLSLISIASALLVLILGRQITICPPGIAMVGLASATFLMLPFTTFGLGFADYRLPIAIAAIGIAALQWTGSSRVVMISVAAGVLCLAVLRVGFVTLEWSRADHRYREIIETIKLMEPGKRLKTVIAAEDLTRQFFRRPPIDHASALAVIFRHAFVPTLFAEPEKQLVVFAPQYAPFTRLHAVAPLYSIAKDPISRQALLGYDYVLIFARMPLRREVPEYLVRVDNGVARDLALFAVNDTGDRPSPRRPSVGIMHPYQSVTTCDER